ncbi:hypothetical protein BC834DRAFT_1032042 [Gloeopeniophorella convolvens]|nr:hypothetical protein BC834DRAFT_1032042 [Gloeopeniophorella convolvens]
MAIPDNPSPQLSAVLRMLAALAVWDLVTLDQLFAPDFVHETLPASAKEPPRTREEELLLIQFMARLMDRDPLKLEVYDTVESEGKIWAHLWQTRFTRKETANGVIDNESIFLIALTSGDHPVITSVKEFVDTKSSEGFRKAASSGILTQHSPKFSGTGSDSSHPEPVRDGDATTPLPTPPRPPMDVRKDLLATLPVELLWEIQFYALSDTLPLTSRRLHAIFASASPHQKADYIFGRHLAAAAHAGPPGNLVSHALRFPLCTLAVLDILLARADCPPLPPEEPPDLPRRLFRRLGEGGSQGGADNVLPMLRALYAHPRLLKPPDPNSHAGYPLARAVLAGATPLVRFLLDHGASPRRKDALAVTLAIKRRDLALVRLLVEAPPEKSSPCKRRKRSDRVEVTSEMLKLAVRCRARDIAEYLINEKGCVPDLRTLALLSTVDS